MIQAIVLSILIVAIAVLVQYEFIYHITTLIPQVNIRHRPGVLVGVFGALIAHSIEIGLFAIACYYFQNDASLGYLQGNFDGSFKDCVYYSFTIFTTLGFGDIEPFGEIRMLTGLESLTGLVLVTWSASFLYYEMYRHWNKVG